ncbi:serine/arginine repetitive matrix protein 1-like [Salvia divinorum]|uniref:Serine/arginine repetitive matrix protein 1-like n=1 Tax=Salvia divinorum TaxID=28513 RepID=A0ABD1G7I5_SALDI
MASTAPAKSQPLHNFTLPHLKWNNDRNSNGQHQRRRSIKSPSRRSNISSASPIRQSPLRDSVSATPPRHQSPFRDSATAAASSPRRSPVHGDYLGKRSPSPGESSKPRGKHSPTGGDPARHESPPQPEASGKGKGGCVEHRRHHSNNSALDGARNGHHSSNSEHTTQKSEHKSKAKEVDAAGIKRSKILIKIPCKSSKTEDENSQEEPLKKETNDEHDCSGEAQEEEKINNNITDEETKTWNLRPRKPLNKSGAPVKSNGPTIPERSKAQSPLRSLNNRSGENDGGNGGKKEKRKLSVFIPLTKDEIEEDIFALTGSKPARRPKKRAKNIQKQVDVCFPGLWLVSITADSYKVSENSLKVQP